MTAGAAWRSSWRVPTAAACGVVALDQATKWWALEALADGRTVDLVWTLRFRLVHNTGAAFSQGQGLGPLIVPLVVVVVVLLVRFASRSTDQLSRAAVGMVVGGAVGNQLDRGFRAGDGFLGGAVVDFVDLQWWPVFNVADSAVVVGAALILWAGRGSRTAGA